MEPIQVGDEVATESGLWFNGIVRSIFTDSFTQIWCAVESLDSPGEIEVFRSDRLRIIRRANPT